MYTIRQAALRTGVSVPLLRAWERRYGLVRPERTGSGYRLYGEDDLARIRRMRRLVDEGWSPAVAARAVVDGIDAAEATPREGTGDPDAGEAPAWTDDEPRGPDPLGGDRTRGAFARRFADAAASLDGQALGLLLDEAFALGSVERVASGLVFPALALVGERWAAGTVDIAAEHTASHAVLRRLGSLLEAAGPAPRRPRVVVGLPPGVRHELGALLFTIAARRQGLPVVYLGPDVPVGSWLFATEPRHVRAAVVGAVTHHDARAASDVAQRMASERPGVVLALGGPAAGEVVEADHALRLPQDPAAAVDALRTAIRDTAPRPPP